MDAVQYENMERGQLLWRYKHEPRKVPVGLRIPFHRVPRLLFSFRSSPAFERGCTRHQDTALAKARPPWGTGPHHAEEGRPASVRPKGRSRPEPKHGRRGARGPTMRRRADQRLFARNGEVGPGKARPPWGRGPTMRRRADQRLFARRAKSARAKARPTSVCSPQGRSRPGQRQLNPRARRRPSGRRPGGGRARRK